MTKLVKCPACGIKTSAGRMSCPRCKTSLTDATVCGTTAAVPMPLPRATEPGSQSVRNQPDGDETPTPDRAIFDTDISALFPKRRRFGVIDLLLAAGMVGWLVVISDVRVWVDDGVVSFAASSAWTGVRRAAGPTRPETAPVSARNRGNAEHAESDEVEGPRMPPSEALPEAEPLPPAAVSMSAGNTLFERGEFPAAVAQFEAAVAVAPDDSQARNNLGQTLVRLDRQTEAVPHFEEAVRLDPGRWAYRFNLGHALGDLGWWSRAVVQYRSAAELFPDDFATHYNLGRALHQRGDYRAAVAAYLRAIALAPDEPTFYLSLAVSYEALARPADVLAAYDRYLDMAPESAQADGVRARMDVLQRPTAATLE